MILGKNNFKIKDQFTSKIEKKFQDFETLEINKKLKDEKCDFVFASRYEKDCGSEDDTLITLVGNYIFTFLGKIFFKLNITDILYTFVMARASCAKELKLTAKDFSFCVEFPIKAKKYGYISGTIPAYERARIGGKKKVNALKDGILILFKMIKLFFIKN